MKYIVLIAVSGIALTGVKWALFPFLPRRRLPRHRARYLRLRLRLRLHPGAGHATIAELWLRWGRLAMLRRSSRARPGLSLPQRILGPASGHSILIGRAHYGHALRMPLDEHAVVTSPPREGKTGWLASAILRYPGPVLSTTTKHDMFALTSGVRAQRGPVHVFNPQNIGDVPSTFRWNPIDGCENPATAIRRADAFAYSVSQRGVEEANFWASKASDYLRAYFHAAALAGLDLTAVARWVTGTGSTDAENILAATGTATGWQWASQLAELRGQANRTAQTIRMTMSRALAFLADPALAASVLPAPGDGFGIEAFLFEAGTLYLIAETRGEDSPVAPLFACLADEIHYTAALTGSRMPGGRLHLPLLMALDEVTQICPVPVPSWLADSGGKGIQIITVAHGEAQLRSRWGPDGARIIMDTSAAKIWLPGISDPAALDTASVLCGTAAMREHGDDWTTRQPVMTPDMIRQLPAARALVIRGGHSPVIGKLRMIWRDPIYRRARHLHHATAALNPGPPTRARPMGAELRHPRARPRADSRPQPRFRPGRAVPVGTARRHVGRRLLGRRTRTSRVTTGNDDDVLAAALLQIAGQAEQLADLRTQLNAITSILGRHATVINALDGLDRQVASLTDRLAELTDSQPEAPSYQPVPAPRWWQLPESEREADIGRLRAWIEQVYQPGYGHLAAALPQCWHLHLLCLYTLDWLSELWSALYLTGERTAGTLGAQAEWQTRLLPAAAGQMAREASRCNHRNQSLRHPPGPPNWPGGSLSR